MITPRNLIKFVLLISVLVNIMIGSCNRMVGSCNGRESHIVTLWNKSYLAFFVFSENLLAKNHSSTSLIHC